MNTERPLVEFEEMGGVRLMWALSWVLVFSALAIGASQWFSQGRVQVGAYLLVGLGCLSLIAVSAGRAKLSAWLLCWGTDLGVLLASGLQAGLLGSAWVGLPVVTMVSGWLFGPWHVIALSSVNAVCIAWMYQQHASGAVFMTASAAVAAVTYVLSPALAGIVGLTTAASFRFRYAQAQRLGAELAQANAELEQKVQERSASLSAALDDIKRMQSDMVESEKLASLGALVAGISHELNTPIGNALTVSSTLGDKAGALRNLVETGALTRSELNRAVADFEAAAQLINHSLQRSTELIASFKQVSIDQTSERRRVFQLDALVNDVLATLMPMFKPTALRVVAEIAPGVACDSYPGPLGQVLSNLVINAKEHAFEPGAAGTIRVTASVQAGRVQLSVSDDGMGMSDSVRSKVFEPFFTTKMGRGGSGLGLSVSYRICTNVLGGQIQVESTPGGGSTFTVNFPLQAPGKIG